MKSLKSKVVAAFAMLVVAAVMMTSASFAWYTVSTQGEAKSIDIQMVATDTVEIAATETAPDEVGLGGSGNQETWGGSVAYTASTIKSLATWNSGSGIKVADYDATGRLASDTIAPTSTVDADFQATTATAATLKDANGNVCAVRYEFWLRTNKAGTLEIDPSNLTWTANNNKYLKMVVVDAAAPGTELATWTNGSTNKAEITPKASGDYFTAHVYVFGYADGEDFVASDLDSATTTQAKVAGSLVITRK